MVVQRDFVCSFAIALPLRLSLSVVAVVVCCSCCFVCFFSRFAWKLEIDFFFFELDFVVKDYFKINPSFVNFKKSFAYIFLFIFCSKNLRFLNYTVFDSLVARGPYP